VRWPCSSVEVAGRRNRQMFADVLCLSHLRWGFVYQRPNHLMSRCARDRRVFFIEEPVFDGETARLEVVHIEHGLYVAIPHLAIGRGGEEVTNHLRFLVDDLVASEKITRPLLWLYTPMALGWAKHIERTGCVYDCMDELSCFAGAPLALRQRERELFAVA